MIEKLTKNDIEIINNSFFNKEKMISELEKNPYGNILIYIENDEVIGYIYYSDIYERTEINQLEVRIDKRNKKIGSKLLQNYLEITNKQSSLEVRIDNNVAIKLYTKYKYRIVANRASYYNGVDAYLMTRDIPKNVENG